MKIMVPNALKKDLSSNIDKFFTLRFGQISVIDFISYNLTLHFASSTQGLSAGIIEVTASLPTASINLVAACIPPFLTS